MSPPAKEQARRRSTSADTTADGVGATGIAPPRRGKARSAASGGTDARERKNARQRDRYRQRQQRRRHAFLGLSWGATYLLHRLVHEGPVFFGDCAATDWSRHSLVKRGFATLDSDGYMRATTDGQLAAERRW